MSGSGGGARTPRFTSGRHIHPDPVCMIRQSLMGRAVWMRKLGWVHASYYCVPYTCAASPLPLGTRQSPGCGSKVRGGGGVVKSQNLVPCHGGLGNLKMGAVPCRAAYLGPCVVVDKQWS